MALAELVEAAGADPVSSEIVAGLVVDACSMVAQRVAVSTAGIIRRAGSKPSAVDVLQWDAGAFMPTLAALASIPRSGTSAAEAKAFLAQSRVSTIVRQVLASELLGEYETRKPMLVRLMAAAAAEAQLGVAETYASDLVDALHRISEEAVSQIRSTSKADIIAEQVARTILVQATLDSIDADVARIVGRDTRDLARDQEWLTKYRAQCVQYFGTITPPDTNRRISVPLQDLYVPGRLTSAGHDAAETTVYQLIPRLDRHVILGDPGGGKSTATRAISHHVARNDRQRVPLRVTLRTYAGVMAEQSVVEHIERTLGAEYQIASPPPELIENLLREGAAVVLFDGLDELLDPARRSSMAEKVELFSRSYPSVPIVVTSRRVGYEEARLDPGIFHAFVLGELTDEDVRSYVDKWFTVHATGLQINPGETVKDVANAFVRESRAIADLRSNPLLLALLCAIYKGQNYLPQNRIGIYQRCTDLLFDSWDKSRGLVFNFTFDAHLKDALKHLAFWIFTLEDSPDGVTEQKLVGQITEFFTERAYESEVKARTAAQEFIEFCKGRAWVLTETGHSPNNQPLFSFVHRTFLEYYAAVQLTRKYPDPDKLALQLIKHVSRNQWDTVALLAIQQIDLSVDRGAELTITKMVRSAQGANRSVEYRINTLSFIVRCLRDLPSTPRLQRTVFDFALKLVDATPRTLSRARGAEFHLARQYIQLYLGELYTRAWAHDLGILDALVAYVQGKAAEPGGLLDAMFAASSALRESSKPEEHDFFKSTFLDGVDRDQLLRTDALRVGYFSGSLSVREVAQRASNAGLRIMDPWLVHMEMEIPFIQDEHYCLAYSMLRLDRNWTDKQVNGLDRSGDRWIGTLVAELGQYLTEGHEPPYASAELVDQAPVAGFFVHVQSTRQKVDPSRTATILALACLFAERSAERDVLRHATQVREDVIDEAARARRSGRWPGGGYFASLPPSLFKENLKVWARGEISFIDDRAGSAAG
ncbi:hypothetical protein SRABI98_00021 [Microbacterium sp. Bi98]|uniref:NACHT domain-containing protein n=1 Tax=Microbacterium sp. Bi98 TaxID=2821116 RepID=UPI001D26A1D8|nr:NACHT domain-containing protein [Microbacterium sp. Bi98]CAH0123632.1 hypothetical protein SRABI98_00021 [Microbacterium sp. Bi98]